MANSEAARIVARAAELLWAVALCDVENVSAHRSALLRRLGDLEQIAAQAGVADLYTEAVNHHGAIKGA